jgi:hypothetical protein
LILIARLLVCGEKNPPSTAYAKSSSRKENSKREETGCGLTLPLDRSRFGRRHGPTVLYYQWHNLRAPFCLNGEAYKDLCFLLADIAAEYDTLEVAEVVDPGRGLEKADSAEQSFELL